MNSVVTKGIILDRRNFQEADRIITVLTPDQGKLRLIAKGVRRVKSKLAGGIELFSVSDITFIPPRREIGTLVSSRLDQHYGSISRDITRTMLGYEFLKRVNRVTEDQPDKEYFELLQGSLAALDSSEISPGLVELWFSMQLLKITGHSPKLKQDVAGKELSKDKKYVFSHDDMAFTANAEGQFSASHIKLLRLAIGTSAPSKLVQVNGTETFIPEAIQLANTMLGRHIRI